MRTAIVRPDCYTRGAVLFHWAIALLVIVNLAIGLLHESLLDGVKAAIPLHKSIGLTVLVFTIGRIGWRLAHRPPPLPVAMPEWERLTARATHAGFYGLMVALPLTGWAMVSKAPLLWFGLAEVPLLPVSKSLGRTAHEAHGLLGYVMVALVLLHVGAALRHHYIKRDATLSRMIPTLAPRG